METCKHCGSEVVDRVHCAMVKSDYVRVGRGAGDNSLFLCVKEGTICGSAGRECQIELTAKTADNLIQILQRVRESLSRKGAK